MSEFVIEELAYLMVDTKKFKVVDRKSLDAIKSEQDFQYSGDVDDNSAVSIGKLLGASIVITGSISGSGSTRRLRAKALDVKTAEIVAMASERF
jgi:curli biogenesis system outer membrane secretion channel CsgG